MDALGRLNKMPQTPQQATSNSASNASTSSTNTRDRSRIDASSQNQNTGKTVADLQEEKKRKEERMANVVSVSQDGDTVQVNSRSNDGRVTNRDSQNDYSMKAQLEKEKADREEKAQAAKEEKVTSFVGLTKSDIERLYQQGRISRVDYEKQIALRQERLDLANQNSSENANTASRLEGTLTRAKMDKSAIQTAFSDKANANAAASATERMAAMTKIQNNTQTQKTEAINEGRRQWLYQLQA